MNREGWEAVVLFLEPIDLICSISKVCNEWNDIANRCSVKFNHSDDCWQMTESYMSHQLIFHNDFLVMKYQKFFIRHHVRQLALKLSSRMTFNHLDMIFENEMVYDLELFKCYHCMLVSQGVFEKRRPNSEEKSWSLLSYLLSFFVTPQNLPIVKNVLIGKSQSGKGTLFKTILWNKFWPNRYVAIDYINKHCSLFGNETIIQLWGLRGIERFYSPRELPQIFTKSTEVFIACFYVHKRDSFESVKNEWFHVERDGKNSQIVLLGLHRENMERQVSYEEAFKVAFENDQSIYLEASSSDLKNIYVPTLYSYLYRVLSEPLEED